MLLGPKSLQLGKTWSDAHARVAARTARQRDLAQLPALDRATRASTDRAAGSALATLRGANQRFLMRKPEVRGAFRSRRIFNAPALTHAFVPQILIGRSTDEQKVDIDLSLEGASTLARHTPFWQHY